MRIIKQGLRAAPRFRIVCIRCVGKSFAYLVPAIQALAANPDLKIVISTHTIGLQEQLVTKDIPFLQSVMPEEFRPVLVKGRTTRPTTSALVQPMA